MIAESAKSSGKMAPSHRAETTTPVQQRIAAGVKELSAAAQRVYEAERKEMGWE